MKVLPDTGAVRVAITGATGVLGTSAVRALVAAGHDVVGLARTPAKAAGLQALGASAVTVDLFDHDGLVAMFEGAKAVCSFATHIPVGYAAAWPRAWRQNDRLRTLGVRRVAEAAHAAGVRRLVQESVSCLYADHGDEPITETSPLAITPATEPAAVAESHVQAYQCGSRHAVVLRFGTILGADPSTRWLLRAAGRGRPVGIGSPDGWVHLVHTDDLGGAVLAALAAPSGVYNVGAEPVRRRDLVRAVRRGGRGAVRRLPGAGAAPAGRLAGGADDPVAAGERGTFPPADRLDSETDHVRRLLVRGGRLENRGTAMTDPARPAPAPAATDPAGGRTPRQEAARRRRLAAVFGDALPRAAGERAESWGDRDANAEEWLRSQVPPHYGKQG